MGKEGVNRMEHRNGGKTAGDEVPGGEPTTCTMRDECERMPVEMLRVVDGLN